MNLVIIFQSTFGGLDVVKMIVCINKHAGVICGFDQPVVFVILLLQFGAVGIVNILKLIGYNSKVYVFERNILLQYNLSISRYSYLPGIRT